MAHKSANFLTAALASTALVLSPVAAQAGGMSHFGMGAVPNVPQLRCPENAPRQFSRPVNTNIRNIDVNKPVSVNKNIDVNKPTSINKNIEVNKPTTINKNIEVNKPVSINKTINENKNININNNININKNIDNSKNININKTIVINKSSAESEALAVALAAAVAAAASSSTSSATANGGNVSVNVNGGSSNASANAASNAAANASSFANSASYNNSAFFGVAAASSYVSEAPGFVTPDEININVSPAEVVATAPQACTFQEATVIKAIHAVCVSADHHEFPASHMVGDTWINAGYEGEIARCLPGSSLKVTVGSVIQSTQGAAVSNAHGETLICAPHEALRHFKNGVLKCAVAVPVPDCTERTNLRKFGTGDMFFSYVTKVCLETGRELVGGESREFSSTRSYSYNSGY